jgi:hypothetical protein
MQLETRRSFNQKILGSLMAYGLIETVFSRNLFADTVKPVIHRWMVDLNDLCRSVKDAKLMDTDFQLKLEELYKHVNLPDLVKLIDLEGVTRDLKYPTKGAASLGADLTKVPGLPAKLAFGKQIFAMNKGRSVVPHGHDNMCTGFIILRGKFVGKHYDRVEDKDDHYLIKPTIDRGFGPGECSTISDHKDNVHWFKAETDAAAIFNVHVMGYNPSNPNSSARVYVDPDGEKVAGGLIVAKKITSRQCHEKYG